jgi:hypothetical protein
VTTTDVTRANRLELEVLALRAENADLRAQLAAVMEPFEVDSPWSNVRVDSEASAARGHVVMRPNGGPSMSDGRWSGPIGTVVDGPFAGGEVHVAPVGTPLPDGA